MGNKENFLKLVSEDTSNTVEKIKWRIKNRDKLRKYGQIAYNILNRLDAYEISIEQLANLIDVDYTELRELLKGKSEISSDILDKINNVLWKNGH